MSDWQLERLPGDVRQEAENAAQRDGVPLHRWLGKLIRDTCVEEGVAPSRELSRAASNETAGNGQRYQQAAPRPAAESIRPAPQARSFDQPQARSFDQPQARSYDQPPARVLGQPHARAVDPPPAPAEPPRAFERPVAAAPAAPANGTYRGASARDAQIAHTPVLRASELPRQTSRIAPVTRETPPAAPTRLSTISPAPRGMPPMPSTPPTPTPSRFSTEPRPVATAPRPEPARQEQAAPPPPAAEPAAPAAAVPSSNDRQLALSTLVQSLRRNELSPVGEARTFLKLMTEHLASIGDISLATGRTREQIARSLRLLGLSDRLRDLIDRGALSREQAFALLDADDPDATNPVVPPSSGHRP